MMQRIKRPVSILLAVIMVLSLFTIVPIAASAAVTGNVVDGTLTISGSGDIEEKMYYYRTGFIHVIIEDGITGIGDLAFGQDEGIEDVMIPASVTRIGDKAFYNCSTLTNVTFVRSNAESALTIGGSVFGGVTGTLSYSGDSNYALFDGNNEIAEGTSLSALSGKTLTWKEVAPAPDLNPVYADDLAVGDMITSAYTSFETGDYAVVVCGGTYALLNSDDIVIQNDDLTFPVKSFVYDTQSGIFGVVPLEQYANPYEAILDPGSAVVKYVPVDKNGNRTDALVVLDKTDDTITLGGYDPVEVVKDLIEALPDDITLEDKDDVEAARDAYDALTDAQKAYVGDETYDKLLGAEATIAALEKEKADMEAADAVTALIEALPDDITIEDKDDVEAARDAYDALTDDQKAYVEDETYDKLTDAEDAIANIIADQQAADEVADMINALPNVVKLTDKATVEAARAAYDALTDDQKALIDDATYAKLTTAEAIIGAIEEAVADMQEVLDVVSKIAALPTDVTMDDKDDIEAARAAYDALSDAQKAKISDDVYKKLTDAEEALDNLYLLGDADGSGEVDALDATIILRKISGMRVPDPFIEKAADVDCDGDVNALDATLIQRYLANMHVKYPIGQWV